MKLGRRFIFGIVAIICASITTIILKYPPEIYVQIFAIIAGLFTISQTVTDSIDKSKRNP